MKMTFNPSTAIRHGSSDVAARLPCLSTVCIPWAQIALSICDLDINDAISRYCSWASLEGTVGRTTGAALFYEYLVKCHQPRSAVD
jgi:hypothetical protein